MLQCVGLPNPSEKVQDFAHSDILRIDDYAHNFPHMGDNFRVESWANGKYFLSCDTSD